MNAMTPLPLSGLPGLDAPEPSDAPVAVAPVPVSHLSGAQKAAIIVHALALDGVELSLDRLPEEAQARLIREVGRIGATDPAVVEAVKQEFTDRLERSGLTGAAGLRKALELLGGSVSTSVAARLREQTGPEISGDPWIRICEKDCEDLLPVIERESVEVAAVILSKLAVSQAAALLGMMPGDRARRITYAISLTSGVSSDVIRRIGLALAGVLSIVPDRAFEDGPVERVGAILNFSRAATRTMVLEGLDEADRSFAEEVRRAIFTFGNIPDRVDPRDVPKLVRKIDQEVLVRALAAALPGDLSTAAEFLLGGLSQRMADALRGEIEDLGPVGDATGEEAMGAVVATIRELEAAGEIYLIADGDGSAETLPDPAAG